ncbi:hypothetical protein [Geminicoccus roseus]|uniref:hypothetical protein n=1 Tax=Geminicoccus roseus TaxID=404900 RepID=UPI000484BFC6|nr:hypothetical protein [Geminicoccus roseus]
MLAILMYVQDRRMVRGPAKALTKIIGDDRSDGRDVGSPATTHPISAPSPTAMIDEKFKLPARIASAVE